MVKREFTWFECTASFRKLSYNPAAQYTILRLIVRSREVSKPWDFYLELSDRPEIWQTPRQHCCRCACQIAKRYDHPGTLSRAFETLRDLTIRRLIGYWNGTHAVITSLSPNCVTLHWRHNDHDGVSNHQPHGCLLNRFFRRRSKKTSKPRVTGAAPTGDAPTSSEWSTI